MQDQLAGGWTSVLILGLIEGVTEFLPISSTGHLILAAAWLGETGRAATVFHIVIQLGAIAAICWHYRTRLAAMTAALAATARHPTAPLRADARLALQIVLAFLPAAALGVAFHDLIKSHLFAPSTVAAALAAGGIAIILIERRPRPPTVTDLGELRHRDALLIGIAQATALIPGVSRAGATIIGGMLCGLNRPRAAEFSFLLALPTMLGAAVYDLYQNADLLSTALAAQIAGGFAAAFVAALVTVRALLAFVSRHTFTPFGWYRIALAAVVLAVPGAFAAA